MATKSEDIIKASESLSLAQASDVELRTILVQVYLLIGINLESIPQKNSAEENVLFSFIRNNMAKFTCQDVLIAFNLALSRRIENVNTNHYNKFSAAYFAEILFEYDKQFRRDILTKHLETKSLPEKCELSQKEKDDIADKEFKNGCIKYFEEFGNNEYPIFDFNAAYYYDFLSKINLINLTNKQKEEYIKDARIALIAEKSDRIGTKIKDDDKNPIRQLIISLRNGKEAEMVKEKAKRLALDDFYSELKFDGKDLKKLINEAQSTANKGM